MLTWAWHYTQSPPGCWPGLPVSFPSSWDTTSLGAGLWSRRSSEIEVSEGRLPLLAPSLATF